MLNHVIRNYQKQFPFFPEKHKASESQLVYQKKFLVQYRLNCYFFKKMLRNSTYKLGQITKSFCLTTEKKKLLKHNALQETITSAKYIFNTFQLTFAISSPNDVSVLLLNSTAQPNTQTAIL